MSNRIDCFWEIGEAIGKMAVKLSQDQELIRLLTDMSTNPLDEEKPDIILNIDFINGRIRTVPNVDTTKLKESTVVVLPTYGYTGENSSFSIVSLDIDIFNPTDKWSINAPIQRPYYIMSRIKSLLDNSRVTGIGTLRFDSFESNIIDSETSLHTMRFIVDANS